MSKISALESPKKKPLPTAQSERSKPVSEKKSTVASSHSGSSSSVSYTAAVYPCALGGVSDFEQRLRGSLVADSVKGRGIGVQFPDHLETLVREQIPGDFLSKHRLISRPFVFR
jgi:hypothetical protein